MAPVLEPGPGQTAVTRDPSRLGPGVRGRVPSCFLSLPSVVVVRETTVLSSLERLFLISEIFEHGWGRPVLLSLRCRKMGDERSTSVPKIDWFED